MAVEIIGNGFGTPINPSGQWDASLSTGLLPGYFKGTLKMGMGYRLSQLVGFRNAETVLVQHQQGTGQVRIGRVNQPPAFYQTDWSTLSAGPLTGRDGWTVVPAWSAGFAPLIGVPPVLSWGQYYTQLPQNGYTVFWKSVPTPFLAAPAVADAIPYEFNYDVFTPQLHLSDYNVGGAADLLIGMVQNGSHNPGGGQHKWKIYVRNEAPGGAGDGVPVCYFVGSGGPPPFFNCIPDAVNRLTVQYDGAGLLTFLLNGVVVGTDAIGLYNVASGGEIAVAQSMFTAQPVVPLYPYSCPGINWYETRLGVSGLLLADGGGERLEAQITPLGLNDLGLGVDSAAVADAEVEVLVLGY